MSVGVGSMFETVCLSVFLSFCPQHNSIHTWYRNDLRIYSKWYAFGVRRSKVKITGSISPFCILEPRFIDIR